MLSNCLLRVTFTLLLTTVVSLNANATDTDADSNELPLPILLANAATANYQTDQAAVVLLQNFSVGDNSQAELADWVRRSFGTEFSFVRDDKSLSPSGIISRFSMVQYGVWESSAVEDPDADGRSLWAKIKLPGKTDLWVVNTHFALASETRYAQAKDLLAQVVEQVADEDYLIIGGQLNITDPDDPALEVLGTIVDVEGPRILIQQGSDVYDWLLADTDLMQYWVADDEYQTLKKVSLNLNVLHAELYRLLKRFRLIDLSDYFQRPPVTLDNAVTIEGTVSPILFRNRHEYIYTPIGPGTRSLEVIMESAGPGDADLLLAYRNNQSSPWIFYANQATPGTSDESISISNPSLLNREWRIIVEYSAGSTAPYRLRAFEVVDLQALHGILNPAPAGPSAPQANLSAPWQTAPSRGWRFYALDVPANAADLLFELTRTSAGEAHLYVQKDSLPWFNNYAFTSQSSSIVQTLLINGTSVPALSTGTWYLGAYAPSPQDADYDLTTTLSCCVGLPPVSGDVVLANGISEPGAVWFEDWQYYVLDVPLNATDLTINLAANGLGDADLYYSGASQPTLSSSGSWQRGTSQEQFVRSYGGLHPFTGQSPHSAHIGVHGYSAAAYELTATWTDTFYTQRLSSGEQVFLLQNFSVYNNPPLHFAIEVPTNLAYSELSVTAVTQDDVVLYLRQDSPADKYNFDFSANSTGSSPSVLVNAASTPVLTPGTWWFALYSNDPRSDIVELRAELRP